MLRVIFAAVVFALWKLAIVTGTVAIVGLVVAGLAILSLPADECGTSHYFSSANSGDTDSGCSS